MNYSEIQDKRKENIKLGQAKNQATNLMANCFLVNRISSVYSLLSEDREHYKKLVKLIYKINKEIDTEVLEDGRQTKTNTI